MFQTYIEHLTPTHSLYYYKLGKQHLLKINISTIIVYFWIKSEIFIDEIVVDVTLKLLLIIKSDSQSGFYNCIDLDKYYLNCIHKLQLDYNKRQTVNNKQQPAT